MSKKDEALKLALEAICGSGEFLFNWHDCEPNNEREIQSYQATLADNEKAFTALREALALVNEVDQEQPAQQEPVATVTSESGNLNVSMSWWHEPALPVGTKLYTSPLTLSLAQCKPWVGLTDDEIAEAMEYWSSDERSAYGGAMAAEGEYFDVEASWHYIEAKLKEKNT